MAKTDKKSSSHVVIGMVLDANKNQVGFVVQDRVYESSKNIRNSEPIGFIKEGAAYLNKEEGLEKYLGRVELFLD